MIRIYTNTTTYQNYDANGNPFESGSPQMFFKGRETVKWQLCSATPDIGDSGGTPETAWTKSTAYSGMTGIGAYLTADDNYTQKLQGSLSTAISAGALSTVTAVFANASFATIPASGTVALWASDGSSEAVDYTSRTISGTAVTFTIATGTTVTGSYAVKSAVDVNEEVYMQASLDTTASDTANGLFVFTATAYSEKLRQEIVYSDTREVDVKALELAVFQASGTSKQDLDRFTVDTFSIRSGLTDISDNPNISTLRQSEVVTAVNTMLASGFEMQFSADSGTTWHAAQANADRHYRIRSAASGGTWSNAIAIVRSADAVTVKDAMPTASSDSENYILFTGTTTTDYTFGHLYAKTLSGSSYSYTDKGTMLTA